MCQTSVIIYYSNGNWFNYRGSLLTHSVTLGTGEVLKNEGHGSSLNGVDQTLLNKVTVVEVSAV